MRKPQPTRRAIFLGILLYLLFGLLDSHLTIAGLGGDLTLEGNPFLRYLMAEIGIVGGLLFSKLLVLAIALLMVAGLVRREAWSSPAAATLPDRRWQPVQPHRWPACMPLYVLAFAQGLAATYWIIMMVQYGPV